MSTAAKENPQLPAQELSPGHTIAGKYVIDRVLGRGGVGVVVAATHLALEQKVAIKFLRSDVELSPETKQRFLQEARAAAMIRSEHVARVFDFGTSEQGHAYIVMEHLEGMDLGNVLDGGPLPIDAAVEYVLQACLALAEAHRAGIVHRDLKPANLFLTQRPDGQPIIKILDFGISKIVAKTGRGANAAFVTTSNNMGSPEYMSPEQMRSAKTIDPRADIWALGVVLYELVTGHPAFTAETLQQLFHLIDKSEPAPMESLRPEVPEVLKNVVARCLKKNRMDRFEDVAELAIALRPVATGRAAALVDAVVATHDGPSVVVPKSTTTPGQLPESSTVRSSARMRASLPTEASRAWKGPLARLGAPVIAVLLGLLVAAAAILLLYFGRGAAPTPARAAAARALPPVVSASTPATPAPLEPAPAPSSAAAPPSVAPSVPVDSLPPAKPTPRETSPTQPIPARPLTSYGRASPPPSPAEPTPAATAVTPARPTPRPPPPSLEGTAAYGDRK